MNKKRLAVMLAESGLVWPMVHIDMDGDGEYTFQPPDNDVPRTDTAVPSVSLFVYGSWREPSMRSEYR